VAAALAAVALSPAAGAAQHEQHAPARGDTTARADSMTRDHSMRAMMAGPLGISHVRMGSGTSWLPDSSPMHANHKMWGDWTVMLHGVAFLEYDKQFTRRGDDQLGVIDWEMIMAMRRVGSGLLHLHGMASLEPATIGAKGYPLLLQTGESYKGQPLVDRQHPHDLFMELAAMFEQPVSRDLAVSLYAGAVGEPALGPVAFMHRPSAMDVPTAPLGHHWIDATHISFGVATVGLFTRRLKLEGSVFNGREPDEHRTDLDFGALDSVSGRVWFLPTPNLALQVSAGKLNEAETSETGGPGIDVTRVSASATYHGMRGDNGIWATTLAWGRNEESGHGSNALLVETTLTLQDRDSWFGRFELVSKTAHDLALGEAEEAFTVSKLQGGYTRYFDAWTRFKPGIGASLSAGFVPESLKTAYGRRVNVGFAVFLTLRPAAMMMMHGGHEHHGGGTPQ
jgi:hypothetical protein